MPPQPDVSDPFQAGPEATSQHVYLRETGRSGWPGGGFARIRMLKASATAIHRLWRSGMEIMDYPPLLWRFHFDGHTWALAIPPAGISSLPAPLPLDQLTRRLAIWRLDLLGLIDERTMIRFMLLFLGQEPLEPGRASEYLKEIVETSSRLKANHVRHALERYAASGSGDPSAAAAEYLADRRIPLLPETHPGQRVLAHDWLSEALARGNNWYGIAAVWMEQLRRIEDLGFDLAERPVLRQLWLLLMEDGSGGGQAYFQPTAFVQARRRLFPRTTGLVDELEEEIHRLRRGFPPP